MVQKRGAVRGNTLEEMRKELAAAREELRQTTVPYQRALAVVASREKEIEEQEVKIRYQRLSHFSGLLKERPELIDWLAPTHSLTSCDDEERDPKRCARCGLIEGREYGFDTDQDIEVVFRSV